MNQENPLDIIKQLNIENAAKKEEQQNKDQAEKELKIIEQQSLDNEYLSLQIEKIKSQHENNPLAIKIKEIASQKGSVEEKILEIQREAEMDVDTLKYFEEHKNELLFNFYDEIERLKTEQEDNELVEKVILRENNKKIENLYPQTTAGKEEFQENLEFKVSSLYKEVSEKTEGRSGEIFGMTFDEIKHKVSLGEIQGFLENKQEKDSIEYKKVSEIKGKEKLNEFIEGSLELNKSLKEELENKYISFKEEFSKNKFVKMLDFGLPEFNDIKIKGFDSSNFLIDFSNELKAIDELGGRLYSDIQVKKDKIDEVKETFLKRGLKNLNNDKNQLELEYNSFREDGMYNNLISKKIEFEEVLIKAYNNFFNNYGLKNMGFGELEKPTNVSEFFNILLSKKEITKEEKELVVRYNLLYFQIKEFEEKIKGQK
jgi:hypothetical protein